jgi:predicted lipoprotein with Yx(FWY)xxD motif
VGHRSMHPTRRQGRTRWGVGVATLALTAAGLAAPTLAGPAGAATTPTTIKVAHNKTWGTVLVTGNGHVVYRLTTDPKNKSVCTGTCATVWPPVVLATGQKSPSGSGVKGLGTITRPGGARQVTYQGVPLYLFEGDHSAGQATGNVKDSWGQWWVVNPAHPHAIPKATTAGSTTKGTTKSTSASSGGVAY